MDRLKLLQLNFVELNGSYENFSEDLRWLCWPGFNLMTIPSELYMGHLVAIDMSYSNLEIFEPPTVLRSLQIVNLKDSHKLLIIRNISNIPRLETLILWNCYSLVHVCKTIGDLTNLALVNMTGCKTLFRHLTRPAFSFPCSLHQLFLKDCNLSTDSIHLSFNDQPEFIQYLNLVNNQYYMLSFFDHFKNLRVLDLSFCSRLRFLLFLPSTLAELYIYCCESLEKVNFQSHQFTLQEIGYEGCINLYEFEGYIKLVPIFKLQYAELGHMHWLREYEEYEVCLVGDELTVGRSRHIQMLYEFGIMSTSLPDIEHPKLTPKYISKSSSLSFDVPPCPENKRLKGISVTFKYAISGEDWAWFCKISTANGVVDLMYNPKVFGKPASGEVCVWLSYWKIGNSLYTGDTVNVSIVVLSGLEIHECGVSLVYSDQETMENNMGWAEILGGDLSRFELSTGAYYLCRRDFFELMEVGRLASDWFRILVGDTTDYTEIRGWRKTGRPTQVNPSFTELKTVRCIIDGPQLEDIYIITEKSKLYLDDKNLEFEFTSGLLEGKVKEAMEDMDFYMITEKSKLSPDQGEIETGTRSELTNAAMKTPSPSLDNTSSYSTLAVEIPLSFHNLIGIEFKGNHELKKIIPSTVLHQLQNLEKIYAEGCWNVEEVFEVATEVISNESPTVVRLQNLMEVELKDLLSLKYLWKRNQWRIFDFPHLTRLSINLCNSLEHVITPSMIGSLMQLQELHIRNCLTMEVIVKEEVDENDDNVDEIKFLCLKSLTLENLSSFEGFCFLKKDLLLPSLITLAVIQCPEIRIFTKGRSIAPQLQLVKTSFGLFNVEEDINTFITAKKQEGFVF